MNPLPSEPKHFIFGHMHSIKEPKQVIVEACTQSLPIKLQIYAEVASLAVSLPCVLAVPLPLSFSYVSLKRNLKKNQEVRTNNIHFSFTEM